MNASQQALDLIAHFEGLQLKAYLDPVGVATIGYGTVTYPNGARVAMGDVVSEPEARGFLQFDCESVAAEVAEATSGLALTQNQTDALISFAYNLGIGALLGSTLLKKLRGGDVAGAAQEFLRWNKASVEGVRAELPGLTLRRAAEKALFERSGPTPPALPSSLSPEERVVRAKGIRQDDDNIVVGYDGADNVVQTVALKDANPASIIALLNAYPNLRAFQFCGPNDFAPAGPRVAFTGLAQPVQPTEKPTLHRLLTRGVHDEEALPGDDVRVMQDRLHDLGYYPGPVDGIFGSLTDRAVRNFQADYFGASQADGKVGPLTWAKIWGEARAPERDEFRPSTNRAFLRLTQTAAKDRFGCVVLDLSYFRGGERLGSLSVCSGQPRKQIFRIGCDSPCGSMEPLPEGVWSLGSIEWAGGKDNYDGAIWSNGLGPAKIDLTFEGPGVTARRDVEMHIDWNRATAPGTAGCVGLQNIADFKTLVGWLRDGDPAELFVDWDLGACPQP